MKCGVFDCSIFQNMRGGVGVLSGKHQKSLVDFSGGVVGVGILW